MKRLIGLAALVGAAILAAASAHAQGWPTKTVRVIVPFAAGSASDLVPRTVFEQVSANVGHSIVVDNRGGGGGVSASTPSRSPIPTGIRSSPIPTRW